MAAPPKASWIRFMDAVTLILRETRCDRGEAEPALVAALADGDIGSQRRLWPINGPWHLAETTELQPKFWSEWEGFPEPLDGYVDEYLVDHGKLRAWLTPSDGMQGQKRGRKPALPWDRFWFEIVRIADLDGLPERQADLERQMLNWFEQETGGRPSESTVREPIGKLYRYREARNRR